MKIIKIIIILLVSVNNLYCNDSFSYITGVGTSHFEAHRMAINAANMSNMKITGQSSRKSNDGLWHVIIKVSPK
jgi:hypothetical protein